MWRYALRADEDGKLLGRALDLDGFFLDQDSPDTQQVTFTLVGYEPDAPGVAGPAGNLDVEVLRADGSVLGSYFIHHARVDTVTPRGLVMTAVVSSPSNVEIAAIWESWRHGLPTERGRWTALSPRGRASWLHVVMSAGRRHRPDVRGGRYELDGRIIKDTTGFYCALGEAINGPGGYFGRNLDALVDCLRGDFGALPPFDLVWHASDLSRTRLGPARYTEYHNTFRQDQIASDEPQRHDGSEFDTIVQIFTDAGVRLDLR